MNKKRVLIMDDEEALRMLISMIVSRTGNEPIAFKNGEEGLEWLKAGNTADLILLDMVMPGKSGVEVCQSLRELGLIEKIPVILLTGSTDENLMLQGREAGAKDYLPKPFTPNDLMARVKQYVPS